MLFIYFTKSINCNYPVMKMVMPISSERMKEPFSRPFRGRFFIFFHYPGLCPGLLSAAPSGLKPINIVCILKTATEY